MKRFIQKLSIFSIVGIFTISCALLLKVAFLPFSELRQLKAGLDSDVILFGSSVNKHFSKFDSDRRSIGEMLDSRLSKTEVIGISHNAYHSEIYLEFVRYISNTGKKPLIIIPINLRYFSPGWDLKPGYQFIKERYELNGVPYLVNFKNYRLNTQIGFDTEPIVNFGHKDVLLGDIIESNRRADSITKTINGFILNYMQPVKSGNRKLKALQNVIPICNTNNIELIIYFTPIDYMTAEKLEIKGFKEQVSKNINVITESICTDKVNFIDLSFLLEPQCFDWETFPNEHLNMTGKQLVVNQLLKKIRSTNALVNYNQ